MEGEGNLCTPVEAEAEYQERFRQIAENIQEIFWIIDAATKQIIYVSPAYERVCGRTCASLYQGPLSYREVIHPDDRERLLSHREERGEDWLREDEFRIVRPDGEVRWLSTRTFPIRNAEKRICRLAGVAQDITDRKAAEEKRQRAEAEHKEFIENLPLAVFRADLKGALEMVNPAMVRLLDYESKEELLAKNLAQGVYFRSPEFELMKRQARRRRTFSCKLVHWEAKSARGVKMRRVRIAGRAVRDERGRLRAIEGVVEDIGARWHVETIAETVGVGAGFVDDFVSELATILGCADLLLLHGKLEHEDRTVAETLAAAAVTARSLSWKAQELLQGDGLQWGPGRVNLNRFARQIEEFYRPLLDPRVEWMSELSPDAGSVTVDRARLTKMVFQVVNRARRAMPQGGKLTLSTGRMRMPNVMKRVPYLPNWYGVLRVTDMGPSLQGNFRPQPVEHGMKIDGGKDGKGEGFSMLQRIAEDSDGFVRCSPVHPRGTTIEILWPSIPDGERCCGEEPVPTDPPQPRLVKTPEETTILVLFRPEIERRLALEFLRAEKYQVLEAASAEDAVAKAQSHSGRVDLIFAEEMLQNEVERTVLPKLRLRRHPPPILCTHHFIDGKTPPVARLKRPYLRCELVSRVREMLAPPPEGVVLGTPSWKREQPPCMRGGLYRCLGPT